ncbi:MAG: hypothetical protein KDE27_15565 [Planctomycetes bacterium]|nr:hypothetical protein [Planctomycetota bacterium]
MHNPRELSLPAGVAAPSRPRSGLRLPTALLAGLLAACSGGGGGGTPPAIVAARASKSGSVQLSADDGRLFVVNKVASDTVAADRGSLSVVRVRRSDGTDDDTLLAEIAVGREPYSVSVAANGTRLFVSNGADNSVSVIELGADGNGPYRFATDILVGSEPRGTAIVGQDLYVANYGDGSITVIDAGTLLVKRTIDLQLGARRIEHPFGLVGLPDGDVWVTDFFASAAAAKGTDQIEGFDDGKDARIGRIRGGTLESLTFLTPIADSGFTADRTAFDPANGAANATFAAPAGVDPTAVTQGVFFNQLTAFAYDEKGRRLYLPSIGAQPAPPVRFNVNVQSLVGVVDADAAVERPALHRNLNRLIADNFGAEPSPTPPFTDPLTRLDRAFAADVVAMDIRGSTAVFASRAGAFLLKADLGADGAIELARDARGAVLRVPTTNLPAGVVLDSGATRAYVASDLVGEVSMIDLGNNAEKLRIDTAATPADPAIRRELLGKLAFFTGMGIAADVSGQTDPRTVDTHRFRNMASNGNWSSCASCHPDGMADGVTWLFPTGPRQTISLEGFFAPGSTVESFLVTTDQKISNWNAVRGSITDFNGNSRAVQGGFGFTPQALATIDAGLTAVDVPDSGLVFNQGPRLGVSNALDFMTEWVASLRVLNRPTDLEPSAVAHGRSLFIQSCASCHGGTKWTRATRQFDALRWLDPAFAGTSPATPNLLNPAASVIAAFDNNDDLVFETLLVEPSVGADTLDLANPIEIRGAGAAIGKASAGLAASFVPPSLFDVRNTAPYGHHGRAQTLPAVFEARTAGGLGHPDFGLLAPDLADVLTFLLAIDASQPILP